MKFNVFFLKAISQIDKRTTKLIFNVVCSFIIKGSSVLVSLMLVPLTLDYLTPYEYGVWLTLSSILVWIDYFDIGLGNGLRNRLSEAFAVEDNCLAKKYVSTTFFILLIISLILFLLFVSVNKFIDWGQALNLTDDIAVRISKMILFVFLGIVMSFVLKITTYIYFAKQLPVINSLITFLIQLLSLLFIFGLSHFDIENKLEWVGYSYSFAPVIILFLFFIITFLHYKEISPTIKSFDFSLFSALMGLGTKFFLIQLSCLVIYTTSNLIISKKISPDAVIPYSIAFRYYNILFIVFSIIVSPTWNAVSDAYNKRDFSWIKRTMKLLNVIYFLFVLCAILMFVLSSIIYQLWVGTSVDISFELNLVLAIYILILVYSSLYSNFLNGMNKLNLQLYTILIMGVCFIPLATFLVDAIGVIGVGLSLCLVNLPGAIVNHIQFRRVIVSEMNIEK